MRSYRKPDARAGQVLVAVIVILTILATLVPLMVYYAQRESFLATKQAKTTTAFHLAEAGTEKAYLELALSSTSWTNLQNGVSIANYKFDKSFSDISGGTYAIWMGSGPWTSEVTILSVGRDTLKKETRAIQVVYSKSALTSAVYANGVTANGGVTVEWGPVMSLGSITLSGNSNAYYPQIFAVGTISGSGGSRGTWTASSTPCTDNVTWWAYNCAPGVPPAPSFNLTAYKTAAQADSCTTASGYPNGASPANSCYWPVGQNPAFSGVVMASSRTVYVEGNLSSANGFLWGTVIVMGNMSFTGSGRGAYTIPDSFTSGGIPSTAWKQYQKLDTASVAEYYGDAGFQTLNGTFQFGMNGHPSKQIGTTDNPSLRGFLYVGGTFSAVGGTALHGSVYSPIGISGGSGGFTVYYDSGLTVLLSNSTPTRLSWQDSLTPWPSGL